MLSGEILITGGAGALGREIIRRAHEEKWDCHITIFSTDAIKHAKVRALYPSVHSVIGDICDPVTLSGAMAGKDIVIHAAAVKYIPESEWNSIDTYRVNVMGSLNVCECAMQHNTPHVLGISTDKSCHPANAYGATKYFMEKMFQEYARLNLPTQFHVVRYGNVIESTENVVMKWKRLVAQNMPIQMTDPEMTRFWLSLHDAEKLVEQALRLEAGCILIPKLSSLSIGRLAEYTLDEFNVERVPLRPGEKMHETLLTLEEGAYAVETDDFFLLRPTTSERNEESVLPYSSDIAPTLSKKQLQELLENE